METKASSKALTTYNEWFISAIKSSKVDGDIDEKKLLQNCLNCYNQVKAITNSNEGDSFLKLEEFRLNSTILLFLGCPSINNLSEISTCNEFMPLIKSIPAIDVDKMFVVLRGLKNNKYLRGFLPWLPTEILVEILSKFLVKYKTVTPLSLAISFEIFYSLIYSLQYDNTEKESVVLCLKDFVEYLKTNEVSSNSSKNKLMAYYFMYIVECIHILLKYLKNKDVYEPSTFSFGFKFKVFKSNLEKTENLEYEETIRYCINVLSSVLNIMVLHISSEVWISWHDTKAPSFGVVDPNQAEIDADKSTEKSIQLQIAHTVYSILKILNEIGLTSDVLNQSVNKELNIFLKQVAIDPDYDSDNDLSNLEIIDAMKKDDNVKNKKLVNILLNREDIFEAKECLDYLREVHSIVPKSTAFAFMKKFIRLLKKDFKCSKDWIYVVLGLSSNLTNKNVISILKEDLNYGHCDILKSEAFMADFTQIFNQLSNQSDKECYDSYLRLCLQSGVDVVKCSVDMVLSLPGLSPVLASALRVINFICRSIGSDGLSLITNVLMEKMDGEMTSDSNKEFSVFLVHLLEIPADEVPPFYECSLRELLPVDVLEIFEQLICPRLKAEEKLDFNILNLLEILITIVNLYPDVVVESELLLQSLISLVLLHNNCSLLDSVNCTRTLKVRNSVKHIFYSLETHILKDIESYKEKVILLKIHLSRYDLHFRSVFLVSRLMSEAVSGKTSIGHSGMICKEDYAVDKVFLCIMKSSRYNEECQVPKCSRIEWIWALYIILPDCEEAEWLHSFYLTHSYLGDFNLITPTLKIFQEVLLLLCDSVSRLPKENGRRISLSHCFKCFSNAALKFVNEKLNLDENQFFSLVSIFTWWCKAQRVFDCDAEYPAIFLNSLITALGDLVRAKGIVIGVGITSKRDKALYSREESLNTGECLVEDTNGMSINTSDGDEENKDNTNNEFEKSDDKDQSKTTQKSHKSKAKVDTKIIPKQDFDETLEAMVKVFVTSVRSSEVTSAVAGRLKALCEL